jgi:ribonuclease-3
MAEVATRGAGLDWKTSLQEIASTIGLGVPVYDVVESGTGPRQDLPGHGQH